MFDLEIYIVKLKYTDTILPFKMEIRIVYTEENVCKNIKNHELQSYIVAYFNFPLWNVEIISSYFSVWLWTPESLFRFESLIAKMYFTKIPSSARALDSLLPPRKIPHQIFIPLSPLFEFQRMKVYSGQINVIEWPKYTLTFQQFWKLTNNEPIWCNFKMHVTVCFSIIKH